MSNVDRLRWILARVEESLDETGIDSGELASRACLSRYHFDRMVAAALRESPGSLRRRVLLERSAFRLVTTSDQVIEVAFNADYATPEGFSRAFS